MFNHAVKFLLLFILVVLVQLSRFPAPFFVAENVFGSCTVNHDCECTRMKGNFQKNG